MKYTSLSCVQHSSLCQQGITSVVISFIFKLFIALKSIRKEEELEEVHNGSKRGLGKEKRTGGTESSIT